MKISFSRKGFDSEYGGRASPIIDGIPRSLPIPADDRSATTYGDLGFGDIVETVTKGKITGRNLCHCDPMFENGRCAFGQEHAAQGHLHNKNFSVGDVFLFFGRFSNFGESDDHHRIFGYLRVEEIKLLGPTPDASQQPKGFTIQHPHTIGTWRKNNCLYIGSGRTASHAGESLRLSRFGENISKWKVPTWLRHAGLTYHKPSCWENDETLNTRGKWQEGITDISKNDEAKEWLDKIIKEIHGNATP